MIFTQQKNGNPALPPVPMDLRSLIVVILVMSCFDVNTFPEFMSPVLFPLAGTDIFTLVS